MKKMIPRLVVAAILVNASFYIAAAAVDVSNLLGYNIINLFEAIEVSDVGTNPNDMYTEIIGTVLGAGVGVAFIALIITAPATLLALAVIALILVARKALIILLIVVAPIAFVAYLLPNTESWFKKWYKMFIALLMVFPVIAAVFGASTLASEVLMSIANSTDVEGDGPDQVLYIIALGVAAIPLFAVPALLKGSLAAAGSIGAKISGMSDKTTGYAKKKAMGGRIGEAKTAYDARKQANAVNRRIHGGYIGKGRVGRAVASYGASRGGFIGKGLQWAGAPGKQLDDSRIARTIGADRGGAAAIAAYHRQANEEVERQESTMSELPAQRRPGEAGDDLLSILRDEKQSDERRAAAARRIAEVGGHQHVQAVYDYLLTADGVGDVQQLAADALLKRKPAGLGTSEANGLRTGTMRGQNGEGYMKGFASRFKRGKFGAKDLASMDVDDLVRVAELVQRGDLGSSERARMQQWLDEIDASDTMKVNDEQRNVIEAAIANREPRRLDNGRPFDLISLP